MSRDQDDSSSTDVLQNSDTQALDFKLGSSVRCVMGELKGLEGTVVATRASGRLLVRVAKGVLIEVPRVCLRNIAHDK